MIRYTQSFDTVLAASKLLQARLLRGYYLIFVAGLVIGAVLFLFNVSLGFFILGFSALMLLSQRLDVMDRLFSRRLVRSVLDEPIELDIGDDGIVTRGPLGATHVPWSTLTDVRSDDRSVIFVRDRVLAAYAPTASFSSAVEQAEVIAYSRDCIAAASAKGP